MPTHTMRKGRMRWLAQVKIKGKIVTSKLFPDGPKGGREYKAAVAWEEQTRTAMLQAGTGEVASYQTPMGCSVLEWATAYLADCERRMAAKTFIEKKDSFKRLLRRFPENPTVDGVTPALALQHLQAEYDSRSGYAANKCRKNLCAGWNWAARYIDGFPQGRNPFQAVAKFPEIRKPRYVPPEQDFWAVVDVASPQDRVMLLTMLYLAARRGEVFRLKWQDINFEGNNVMLATRKTKGGSWRHDWFPLVPELKDPLAWWHEHTPNQHNEHVFTVAGEGRFENQYEGDHFKSRQHIMGKLCARAGVKPFGFHAIRHLSAIVLYKGGYPVSLIQTLLRHESATTTARYLKSLGFSHEELSEAMGIFANGNIRKIQLVGNVEQKTCNETSILQ